MANAKVPAMFLDLVPRSREVLVGEVVLCVGEPTMQVWESAMALISLSIDSVQEIKVLAATIAPGGKRAPTDEVIGSLLGNLDQLTGFAKTLVRDLLGKRVPEVTRVVLSTDENAARLELAGIGDKTRAGVEKFITEHLTVRQGLAILEAFIEVNDVADVLGKSKRLGQTMKAALRQQRGDGAPAGAPPA